MLPSWLPRFDMAPSPLRATTLTTETTDHPDGYDGAIAEFYDEAAAQVAAELDAGRDVAVLCEGDPFFYGSYMYLHDRLAGRYETEVIPGVSSVMAGAARLGQPLVRRDTELAILPGTDHMTPTSRSAWLVPMIKDFLDAPMPRSQ